MKKLYLLYMFLFFGKLFSQADTLLKNGNSFLVKVILVQQDTIFYKVINDTSQNIFSISYTEFDRLSTSSGAKFSPKIKSILTFNRHLIGTNTNQFLFSTISLSYQYIFKNGYFGIRIPLSYNLNAWMQVPVETNNFSSISQRRYTTGIDINFYPFAQKKVSYFSGAGLQFGRYDYVSSEYTFANQTTYPYLYPPSEIKHNGLHSSFVFNQGVLFRFSKCFWTDVVIGFGAQRNNSPLAGSEIKARASFQFNLGWSF